MDDFERLCDLGAMCIGPKASSSRKNKTPRKEGQYERPTNQNEKQVCCEKEPGKKLSAGGFGYVTVCPNSSGYLRKFLLEKGQEASIEIEREVMLMKWLASKGLAAKPLLCRPNPDPSFVTARWETGAKNKALRSSETVWTVDEYLKRFGIQGGRELARAAYSLSEDMITKAMCYNLDISASNIFLVQKESGRVKIKLIDTDPQFYVFCHPYGDYNINSNRDGWITPGDWGDEKHVISYLTFMVMMWFGTRNFKKIKPYDKHTDSRLYFIFLKELCYYLQTKVQKPVYFRRIDLQECLKYLDGMGENYKEKNPYGSPQTPTSQVFHYTRFYYSDIYLLGHLFEYYLYGTGPSKVLMTNFFRFFDGYYEDQWNRVRTLTLPNGTYNGGVYTDFEKKTFLYGLGEYRWNDGPVLRTFFNGDECPSDTGVQFDYEPDFFTHSLNDADEIKFVELFDEHMKKLVERVERYWNVEEPNVWELHETFTNLNADYDNLLQDAFACTCFSYNHGELHFIQREYYLQGSIEEEDETKIEFEVNFTIDFSGIYEFPGLLRDDKIQDLKKAIDFLENEIDIQRYINTPFPFKEK